MSHEGTDTMTLIRGYEADTVDELCNLIAPPKHYDVDAYRIGATCDEPSCDNRPEYALIPVFRSDTGWEFPQVSVCETHRPSRARPHN